MLYGDIQGYRFSPSRDIFADISINPENECFCPSGPPCAPHGTFNISACQYGKIIFKFINELCTSTLNILSLFFRFRLLQKKKKKKKYNTTIFIYQLQN